MNNEPENCHVTGDPSGYFDRIAYETYREHDSVYNQMFLSLKYPKLCVLILYVT